MQTKVAFIGFGGVGQSLVQLFIEKKQELKAKHGLDPVVVAVSDIMKGSIYHPDGLDMNSLLDVVKKTGNVEDYPGQSGIQKGWSSLETIEQSNADMIVEVTFTDVNTGQPAIDHCRAAFKNRKSVITTNKGPVALAYKELSSLAKQHGAYWGFEGTVMSGTPALRMPVTTLAGNEIKEISGILNGTTNYILTEMEKGKSYKESLEKAQKLGYAEADPTSDVEGYDARYKAAILSTYLMDTPIAAQDIYCEGISGLTIDQIQEALESNQKWRLIARIKKVNGKVEATVKPELLDNENPLANVTGPTNAILYECDLAGPIMLTGAGAGLVETGYSLLIDLINFKRQHVLTNV